jgi:hypothetical protein
MKFIFEIYMFLVNLILFSKLHYCFDQDLITKIIMKLNFN